MCILSNVLKYSMLEKYQIITYNPYIIINKNTDLNYDFKLLPPIVIWFLGIDLSFLDTMPKNNWFVDSMELATNCFNRLDNQN